MPAKGKETDYSLEPGLEHYATAEHTAGGRCGQSATAEHTAGGRCEQSATAEHTAGGRCGQFLVASIACSGSVYFFPGVCRVCLAVNQGVKELIIVFVIFIVTI